MTDGEAEYCQALDHTWMGTCCKSCGKKVPGLDYYAREVERLREDLALLKGHATEANHQVWERCRQAESECQEQARLLGMGAEREAKIEAEFVEAKNAICFWKNKLDESESKVAQIVIDHGKKLYEAGETIGALRVEVARLKTELKVKPFQSRDLVAYSKRLEAELDAVKSQRDGFKIALKEAEAMP